jgi:predicted nucleotidyltransferase
MGESSVNSKAVRSLSILSSLEQQVAVEFARRVRERMGGRIRDMRIYGSRARREAREDSDLDILVLLDKAPLSDRNEISDIGTDLMIEMLIPFQVAPRVMSQADFDQLRSLERLFPSDIERDGISL